MKKSVYLQLAIDGIRKNRRLYLPYMLTGAIMMMMFYILAFLATSPLLSHMRGGTPLSIILPMGTTVIAVFSLLFLFYSQSFLIRQRNKEFGLYHVLGMDKWNICRILFWENLLVAVCSIVSGVALGIAFSKIAEVSLLNILREEIDYHLSVGLGALIETVRIFGLIYLLLFVYAQVRVYFSNSLELLLSAKTGECPPKGNWLFALIGAVVLGIAYYLAVSIQHPLQALLTFFVAVIMVIIATYLLFITGSVVFCRLLQKNKHYYYKPNHFVSVSSMVYRMKRNGAGLASICILSTMVLVTLSSTASLYLGMEDSINDMCPYDINVEITLYEPELFQAETFNSYRCIIADTGVAETVHREYPMGEILGVIGDDGIFFDMEVLHDFSPNAYGRMVNVRLLPVADYNRIMGTNESLAVGECLLYRTEKPYTNDTFAIGNETNLQVKKVLLEFFAEGRSTVELEPAIYLVVSDLDTVRSLVVSANTEAGNSIGNLIWKYGFDTNLPETEQIAFSRKLGDSIRAHFYDADDHLISNYSYGVDSKAANREDFLNVYGSLLFLGVMLSSVFVFAAVLIIYYKQISEGYEDQSRFEIMQKVGMTKKDIRKSINSQILTVFFLPLAFAGLHLAFAFPLVFKILQLLKLQNVALLATVTFSCFLIFGLFYAIVYKLTAGAYYRIVSGLQDV
ncbi:MAG: ABC transporter permease [Peptococcaceae bacterium]|jgi:putative ABC transport system permease protein|nr:ABC transporter permease [Peptococcaceae bacterium]